MTHYQSTTAIRKALSNWYRTHQRHLPWRQTRDPYRIWVSEVMLQQTQVATVIDYYRRFLDRLATVADLAAADQQTVLKLWEGLGYYARARNLHRAAQIVCNDFAGRVPGNMDAFRKLPGVGAYIGAAVMSIAFEQPFAVVDGNVKRVLARLLCLDDAVNATNAHKTFQVHADELLDRNDPGEFNQAVMELGALICTPKKPVCASCAVNRWCCARQQNQVDVYPRRVPKKSTPVYRVAVGVVKKKGRLLITRRKSEGLLGGLWEFPGGRIDDGETAKQACVREIKEEVNLTVAVESHLAQVKHAYTHFRIIMDVFCCRYVGGRVRLRGPVDFQWVRPHQLDHYPFPKANNKFIPLLRRQLQC